MATKKKTEQRPTILLAYVGVYPGADRLRYAYLPVGEGYATDDFCDYEKVREGLKIYTKRFGNVTPGSVISIETDGDGSTVYNGSAQWIGQVEQGVVDEWYTLSKAAEDAYKTRQAMKSRSANQLAEMLEPVQQKYDRLRTTDQRAVFIARVIATITGRMVVR